MERTEYASGTTATAATTTQTVPIPNTFFKRSRGIVALHVKMTTVQFQHLTRIVVKIDGSEVFDMTPAQYRVYLQRFAKRFNSAAYPADTDTEFSIMFGALEYDEGDPRRNLQQLQPGQISVELGINNTPGAGTLAVSWDWEDQDALDYLQISRHALGIADALTREQKEIKVSGRIKGLSINTTGLTEGLIYANHGSVESPVWDVVFKGSGTDLIQRERIKNGSAATNPLATKFYSPLPGKLMFELTTSGWAGVANEVVLYKVLPGPARQAA